MTAREAILAALAANDGAIECPNGRMWKMLADESGLTSHAISQAALELKTAGEIELVKPSLRLVTGVVYTGAGELDAPEPEPEPVTAGPDYDVLATALLRAAADAITAAPSDRLVASLKKDIKELRARVQSQSETIDSLNERCRVAENNAEVWRKKAITPRRDDGAREASAKVAEQLTPEQRAAIARHGWKR